MNMPPATAIRLKRWLRRLLLAAAAVLAYRALEPVFAYQWGWRKLPDLALAPEFSAADPAYAEAARQAMPLLRELQQKLQLPGISVAVGLHGREVWAYSRGYADPAAGTPLQLDTQIRIGSTSKAFTSAAMAMLVQAGKVDLDAPLETYLPWFTPRQWPVSTRQVLSHTAGFPDYGLCLCLPIWEYYSTRHYDSVRKATARVAAAPLQFQPGTRYDYTSPGYNLAGAVIEAASGQDFLAYLREAVLDPLQLAHTIADDLTQAIPGKAGFYEVSDGRYKRAFRVDISNKWPSGGLLSTPRDLVRFGNALLADALFPRAVREQFWTVQKLADGSPNSDSYALGWRVYRQGAQLANGEKVDIVSHNGTATGATSRFALYPQQGLSIAILTNAQQQDTAELNRLSGRIVDVFLAAAAEPKNP
jgi:serine beta-lactamase-like protein LACTB, mitochondrial